MGQDMIARYPIHWHMAGSVPAGTYVRACSMTNSIFRAVTIHGTQGVLIEGNVAYDIAGHAFLLEDGTEWDNVFRNNLAVGVHTKGGAAKWGSDADEEFLSSYWIAAPNNHFEGNVAAACAGTGFWVHTRLGPRGASYNVARYADVKPWRTRMGRFVGNLVHSCAHGFQIESTNLDSRNTGSSDPESPTAEYQPLTADGKPAVCYYDDFTTWKVRWRGMWFRGGGHVVRNYVCADTHECAQFGTAGTQPPRAALVTIDGARIVGFTDNRGSSRQDSYQQWDAARGVSWPRRGDAKSGWVLYDGPHTVRNAAFVNYPLGPAGSLAIAALGVRWRNMGQMAPSSSIGENVTFENVGRRFAVVDMEDDGGKYSQVADPAGSASGKRGAHLVQAAYPFYYTAACLTSPAAPLVDAYACPHRYVQVWVLDRAGPGSSAVVTRADFPAGEAYTRYALALKTQNSGLWATLSAGATYLVHYTTRTPTRLAFQLTNAEASDVV
ncbi:right-handed parallel beta-helix repeat-containing protein, partial [archaeon]